MTTAVVAGITVEELASRRGLTAVDARALVRPFIEAGLVELHGEDRLEFVHRLVVFAITGEAPEA